MGVACDGDMTKPMGPLDKGGVPAPGPPAAPRAAAATPDPSAFSSSLRLRQATFGFRFLSLTWWQCYKKFYVRNLRMFVIS